MADVVEEHETSQDEVWQDVEHEDYEGDWERCYFEKEHKDKPLRRSQWLRKGNSNYKDYILEQEWLIHLQLCFMQLNTRGSWHNTRRSQ